MPLRFLGVTGTGTTANAVAAILYANANGAHVINNSWGGTGFSQTLKAAIDSSSALVVCAAGNGGSDGVGDDNDSTPFYPASYNSANIIAVAATDHNDDLASFSNYGLTSVDLAAPGNSIYSSFPQFSYGTPVSVYSQNFDGSTGAIPVTGNSPLLGWNRGGTNSTWEITAGTGVTGAGNDNSLEDSPGGNYVSNTSSWAGYMTSITSVKDNRYSLSLQWQGKIDPATNDYLNINYSADGSNWNLLDSTDGDNTGGFVTFTTNEITSAADLLDNYFFGFGINSDSTGNYDGVYIDTVSLTREPISVSAFNYTNQNGTSMAAPHVSGVAGLIKALNASCSTAQIKSSILNNTDAVVALSGQVSTGGRLNAFNALSAAQCVQTPPSSSGGGGGGGCFIATAAYGSAMHPYVKELRNFRDRYLLTNMSGRLFVTLYYKYSPAIADLIRDRELLKIMVRIILTPMIMLVAFPYISLIAFIAFTVISMLCLRTYKRRE